jgi:hypothetical protein
MPNSGERSRCRTSSRSKRQLPRGRRLESVTCEMVERRDLQHCLRRFASDRFSGHLRREPPSLRNGEMVILADDTWQDPTLTASRAAGRPNDVPGSSAAPVTRLKARRAATDSELHAFRLRTFLADPRTRERASQKLSVEAALAGRGASEVLVVLVHSWRRLGRDERLGLRSIRTRRRAAVRCRRPDRREAGSRTAWCGLRPHDRGRTGDAAGTGLATGAGRQLGLRVASR